jgi:formylmethanofuran dehydrogenase subunit E
MDQLATGCTFGKDLIVRLPHGKASVRLVDQARGRAVRVVPRPETVAILEQSAWFHTCSSGTPASDCAHLAEPVVDELVIAPEDGLFTVSAVFPLRIEDQRPTYESVACEVCGERVLASYARKVDGRRLCVSCEDRRRARAH